MNKPTSLQIGQLDSRAAKFARSVFLVAGLYGIVAMLPQYFLEAQINRDYPPAITHPEQYYGFIGVVLAWQIVFVMISRDVVRYRPLMLVAVLEKLAFGVPAIVLFLQGRAPSVVLGFGLIDLVLMAFFAASYRATRSQAGH